MNEKYKNIITNIRKLILINIVFYHSYSSVTNTFSTVHITCKCKLCKTKMHYFILSYYRQSRSE